MQQRSCSSVISVIIYFDSQHRYKLNCAEAEVFLHEADSMSHNCLIADWIRACGCVCAGCGCHRCPELHLTLADNSTKECHGRNIHAHLQCYPSELRCLSQLEAKSLSAYEPAMNTIA